VRSEIARAPDAGDHSMQHPGALDAKIFELDHVSRRGCNPTARGVLVLNRAADSFHRTFNSYCDG